MLKYCENDVLLNAKVYNHLKKESKGFSKQSVELEHEVAWILARQREHGFLLDVKGASLLVAKFEEQLIDLEKNQKAISCFKKIIQRESNHVDANYNLAKVNQKKL